MMQRGKDKRKNKKQKQKKLNLKAGTKQGSNVDTCSVASPTGANAVTQVLHLLQPQQQNQQQIVQETNENPIEQAVTSNKDLLIQDQEKVSEIVGKNLDTVQSEVENCTPESTQKEQNEIQITSIKIVEAETETGNKDNRRQRIGLADDSWRKQSSPNSRPAPCMEPAWRKLALATEEDQLWEKKMLTHPEIELGRKLSSGEPEGESMKKWANEESKKNLLKGMYGIDITKTNTSNEEVLMNTPFTTLGELNKGIIRNDLSTIAVKYIYEEGQWSPTNQEGRKMYGRYFLLQLQFISESMVKPDGLPRIPEITIQKPMTRSEFHNPSDKSESDVGFSHGKSTKIESQALSRAQLKGGGGGNGKDAPRRIITISQQLDTKLHHTENAWKPGQHKNGQGGNPETQSLQELLAAMRLILNKLTPQKFQTLLKQILSLKMDSPQKLKGTINLIFEKAIDEPAFSSTYANLCHCMRAVKVPTEEGDDKFINFHKVLLGRCQSEFDHSDELDIEERQKVIDEKQKAMKESGQSKEAETEVKILQTEKLLAESKARRRTLGNIRFLGELFKVGTLNEDIMHSCINKLLSQMDEESLECLCKLLMTIGKTIDIDEKDKKIDSYFKKLVQLSTDKKISARIGFMMQDVLDLRKDKWVSRRDNNAPKTIDELHKEIQLEDQKKAQMLNNLTLNTPKQHGGHEGGRGRRGRGQPSGYDDGWQSVTKPLRNTQQIEPGRMKITKQLSMEADSIQLGPSTGFAGWGRGSTGGCKASRDVGNGSISLTQNKFSALGSDWRNSGHDQNWLDSIGLRTTGEVERDSRDKLGWTQPRSKVAGRVSSQEKARDGAVPVVRNGDVPWTTLNAKNALPTSNNTDSEEGCIEKVHDQADSSKAGKELSDTEIIKKTEALIAEYLGIIDTKEAIDCVKELESPSKMQLVVGTALNYVIERKPADRYNTGLLLEKLIKAGLVTPTDYIKGLATIVEFAEDMAIDIPKIYQYMAELVGPVLDNAAVDLKLIAQTCMSLVESGKGGVLMAEILKDTASRQGENSVAESWAASGLEWSSFVGKDGAVNDLVNHYGLKYTLKEDVPAREKMSMESIQEELDKLIIDQKVKNEDVLKWVSDNVEDRCQEPVFISSLMTSVCTSAMSGNTQTSMKVETTTLGNRSPILVKYLDHQTYLEVHGLFALQALVHRLNHPAGLLRSFFDALYHEDVISEYAFIHWEANTDPALQAGKDEALKSVVQFFTWLREAD